MLNLIKNALFPSVDSLTGAALRTADKLEALADKKARTAENFGDLAETFRDKQKAAGAESARARRASDRFRALAG